MAEDTKKMQDAEEMIEEDSQETEEKVETEEASKQVEDVSEESEAQEDEETLDQEELAEEDAEDSGEPTKSLFGRKKDKKDKKDQIIEELTDRLQRTMAEFDNFRKRTDKEKASMYIIGAKEIIEKILPIVDNFERGLTSSPVGDAFADGMNLIYKQLMTTLDELGVKAIEAVGQPFDPNYHNAVMHVDDPEQGDNVVVEEFQKGYTYKDLVVRHSMVKVAN